MTVGRSDYGIYRPLLRALAAEQDVELRVFVSGMHLAPEFGSTVAMIEADGYPIAERIETIDNMDSPAGTGGAMGRGVLGFSEAFARFRPDILVVLGDRFDMYPAALAALPFRIPVAHIHGGELTFGAIDDALRHSMTKLSHLHFTATENYARRVVQLGEEPWRVTVCGALGLDDLEGQPQLSAEELERRFGIKLDPAPLLVTFHPATLESDSAGRQTAELLSALDAAGKPMIFTAPNADAAGREVRAAVERFVAGREDAWLVENFGQPAYFSVLRHVAAMIGNSSSGIIEAASFGLPVVNIGTRQAGRTRGANVLDAAPERGEILAAIQRALLPEFRAAFAGRPNPYRPGTGSAASMIVQRLKTVALDEMLWGKKFHDLGHE